MFRRHQKARVAAKEKELNEARGQLAGKIIELDRVRSHVEEMVRAALLKVTGERDEKPHPH